MTKKKIVNADTDLVRSHDWASIEQTRRMSFNDNTFIARAGDIQQIL